MSRGSAERTDYAGLLDINGLSVNYVLMFRVPSYAHMYSLTWIV